ncbi:hypothetical protein BKA56DRAFT_139123 [Ilyonectria sp. MPI-CAGE-AT-0026]|nr:hypothetical protein BKA56DRAFT_139123 [Ilyonectria sp. MPI-CAGE-AT-0026]
MEIDNTDSELSDVPQHQRTPSVAPSMGSGSPGHSPADEPDAPTDEPDAPTDESDASTAEPVEPVEPATHVPESTPVPDIPDHYQPLQPMESASPLIASTSVSDVPDHYAPFDPMKSTSELTPSTPVPGTLTQSSGTIQEAHHSPTPNPVPSMKEKIDTGPEIISIPSTPTEGPSPINDRFHVVERMEQPRDGSQRQASPIAADSADRTHGETNSLGNQGTSSDATSPRTLPSEIRHADVLGIAHDALQVMNALPERPEGGDARQAGNTFRVHPPAFFRRPEVPDQPQATAETIYQSEARPNKDLPTVDQQPTAPVPGAPLATMSAWSKLAGSTPCSHPSSEFSRPQDGPSRTHSTTNDQIYGPQYPPFQGPQRPPEISASSSFSYGLPPPVPSAGAPVSYSPTTPGPAPTNATSLKPASTSIPFSSETPAEIIRLPPISSSRRDENPPLSIPSFGRQDSATGSQVENRGVEHNPAHVSSFGAGLYTYLGSPDQNSHQLGAPGFSNSLQEGQRPTSVHELLNSTPNPAQSTSLESMQESAGDCTLWPYRLDNSIVQQLEAYLTYNNLPQGIRGLLSPEGFYLCPLCYTGKSKRYVRLGAFMTHLIKKH